MRVEFAKAMIDHYREKDQVFLTGDLGYMALEKVRETFGDKFINAGVAEQNMITVAASLAYEGFTTWAYSISPFATLRPYEQIRNDVCHHNLPVKIVGNGGGYGYGIMGSTHHNLEDIAVMRVLPNMKVYVPFVASDVDDSVKAMIADKGPGYLRLNLAANLPVKIDSLCQWRKIKEGNKLVVVGIGPVLGNLFSLPQTLLDQIEIWCLSVLPAFELPAELKQRISEVKNVLTIEEHSGECGINELLGKLILKQVKTIVKYNSLYSKGYISGKYGDQKWHLEENGMHGKALEDNIKNLI
ncbi:MAG: transketolase [Bacteroidia bacterium]